MRVLAVLFFALAGCSALPDKTSHVTGLWGGQHVGLIAEGAISKLEYDCASGTIDGVIVPGPDGRFIAKGTHIPGQGGPVRVGDIFKSYRAEYRGTVRGDVMELAAVLENGDVVGPFTLQRGMEPQITRCL